MLVAPLADSSNEDDEEELGASAHTFLMLVKVRTTSLPEEYRSKDDEETIIEWMLDVATYLYVDLTKKEECTLWSRKIKKILSLKHHW